MGDIQEELSEIIMTNSSQLVEVIKVSGDAHQRFRKDSNGKHEWGSGSAAPDANIYRNAADELKTDDTFDITTLKITGTAVLATATEINRACDASTRIVDCTAATLTITEAAHDTKVVTLNRAAGIAVTLPAATGSGTYLRFALGTTVTSNSTTIAVADATDTMVGTALIAQDGGDTSVLFGASGTDDTITLNGTTTGGTKGDYIELIDVALNLWQVNATLTGTGIEATPFSATI